LETAPTERWDEKVYPSLKDDRDVCEAILHFAAETNGELAYRAFESKSKKTGIDHTHLAAKHRDTLLSYSDLIATPQRVLTTPFWTGNTNEGRTYSAYCQNVEELIPWRTLTGRQHLYLDHEAYVAYGENLPTYKPKLPMANIAVVKRDFKNLYKKFISLGPNFRNNGLGVHGTKYGISWSKRQRLDRNPQRSWRCCYSGMRQRSNSSRNVFYLSRD
jgi:nitrate reductase alpha subunit